LTFQLTQELRLIVVFIHKNNVILLPALENHVFLSFEALVGSLKAYIRLIVAESLTFAKTSQILLEIRLIGSTYT